jgi:hypothetical protein
MQKRQPSLAESFKRSGVICESDDENEHGGDCLVSTLSTPETARAPVVPVSVQTEGQTRRALYLLLLG